MHYIYNILVFILVSSYPLSSVESELVQLLVYCYTPVVASWLETEADVMELFLSLKERGITLIIVEREVQTTIATIETATGESVQQYL